MRLSASQLIYNSAFRCRVNQRSQHSLILGKSLAESVASKDDRREEHGPTMPKSQPTVITTLYNFSRPSLLSHTLSLAPFSTLTSKRCMSSKSSPSSNDADETFSSSSDPIFPDEDLSDSLSSISDAAETMTNVSFEPTSWPSDQALVLLNFIHENILTSYPYAVTIGAATLAIRIVLLPIFIKGQRNSSRVAHMMPEMTILKEQIDKMGKNVDPQMQMRHMQQTRALFLKYDCNPVRSLATPLLSAPFFLSMFFGLKQAPEYIPDVLKNGGIFWFPDLTQPDPLYIMPVFAVLTFFTMTEMGKDQLLASNPEKGPIIMNVFRAMAICMFPISMSLNSGVLVYWTVNNTCTVLQSVLLKNETVKKAFGIWDPPKPVPGKEPKDIFKEVKSLFEKKEENINALDAERVKAHNDTIEKQRKVKKMLKTKNGFQK